MIYIALGIGGAIGTLLRFGLSKMINSPFHLDILFVNIFGSFLLGFISAIFLTRKAPKWLKIGLTTGVCGGFTTMSTFASNASMFLLNHQFIVFIIYMFLSICGGVGFYYLGVKAGKLKKYR